MFGDASAFNQTLCGQAWVDKPSYFRSSWIASAQISDTACCPNTDASAFNSGTCACGVATCTPGTGLLCHSASSLCALGTPCANHDGTAANGDECQCGSAGCTSDTFCVRATSKCWSAPRCANGVGTAATGDECQCGSAVCASDTFCVRDDSECLPCVLGEELLEDYCLPTNRTNLIAALVDTHPDTVSQALVDTHPDTVSQAWTARSNQCGGAGA